MNNKPVSSVSLPHGHEAARPSSLKAVLIIAASVLVLIAACLVAAGVFLRVHAKSRPMQPMQALGILVAPNDNPLKRFPAPNLELDDGHADFVARKQRQVEKLNTYGWIDRTNGIARIPIERAMELMVAGGRLATNGSAKLNAGRMLP